MPARNQKHPASEKQLPADVEPNGTEATLTDGAEPADKGVEWQSRAVEALRQSKEHLRVMADAIPQLAWIAHGDGFIHWYNRRWYEYTGTAPQEMEGWGWQSVHDPEMLPKVLERWKASIATGEPFEMVFPLRGADGRFRQFLTRVQPLKDSQGRVVQWFGTNTDVEELKRAQQALEEAMQRLRFHVENSPLAVIEFDADLRISRWTKEAERMFGWSAEEVCGKGMYELPWIHEEDRRKSIRYPTGCRAGRTAGTSAPTATTARTGRSSTASGITRPFWIRPARWPRSSRWCWM